MAHGTPRRATPDQSGFWAGLLIQTLSLLLLATLILGMGQRAWVIFGFAPPDEPRGIRAAAQALRVEGQVVSTRAKGIGSLFAGRVETLHVQKGQQVQRGQLLFRMDVSELKQRLEQARLELRSADAEIQQARRERLALLNRLREQQRAVAAQLALVATEEALPPDWAPLQPPGAPWQLGDPGSLVDHLRALQATGRQVGRDAQQHVAAAAARKQQAAQEVERLVRLIRQAKRYSPISGVVTSVRAEAGAWTAGSTPVIRVDDPKGYRVVALIRNRSGAVLAAGDTLPIRWSGQTVEAQVHKTVPGWDRQALYTWVWLIPANTDARQWLPGDAVEIHLLRSSVGS